MYSVKQKYKGDEAVQYEHTRSRHPSWVTEQRIVDELCREIPLGSTILDIPSGTGRFFPLYQRSGHRVLGSDISIDMFRQVPPERLQHPAFRGFVMCDAEKLPYADESFDYVVCVRFLSLALPPSTAEAALREFTRVAKKGVILHFALRQRNVWDIPLTIYTALMQELLRSGWRTPARLVGKAKEAFRLSQKYRVKRHSDKRYACTLAELEQVVGEAGFTVAKVYRSASLFQSRRITLIRKPVPACV